MAQPLNPRDPSLHGRPATITFGDGSTDTGTVVGYKTGPGWRPGGGLMDPPEQVDFLLVDFGGDQPGEVPVWDGALPEHFVVDLG